MGTEKKYRVFEITSQEPFLTEDKIKVAVMGHKSIKEDCYILHDKDTYTEKQVEKIVKRLHKDWSSAWNSEDERYGQMEYIRKSYKEEDKDKFLENKTPEVGSLKPLHWHSYIVCNPPQSIATIASWFNTAKQNVEVKKGAGAFVDCVEYSVHDNENCRNDGKYPYPWEELKSINCSVDSLRQSVLDKQMRRASYGRDLTEKEMIRAKVLNDGLSIRDCIDKYPLQYAEDRLALKQLRKDYLANKAPLPRTRFNYFICGQSGYGKDTIARGLSRQFFPDLEDDKLFHVVKDLKVPFEGYDGQPIIIWEDVRAASLIRAFDRDGIFRLFDVRPSRGELNVKYGSICLTNTINILTSVEPYAQFLDGIAGQYIDRDGNLHEAEDKNQSYRRFPFIIPIAIDYMEILVSRAFLHGDTSYQEYEQLARLRGNMARMCYDNRISQLPIDKQEEIRGKIEQKYLGSSAEKLVNLMQEHKSLMDTALSDVNTLVETLFAEVDSPSVPSPSVPLPIVVDNAPSLPDCFSAILRNKYPNCVGCVYYDKRHNRCDKAE